MAGIDVQAYIGRVVTLISKSDIRYEGTLHSIDVDQGTIALKFVKALGSEGRKAGEQIQATQDVYDHILFKGSDIKELNVLNSEPQSGYGGSLGAGPGSQQQADQYGYNQYPQYQNYSQYPQQQQQYQQGYQQPPRDNVDQWLSNQSLQQSTLPSDPATSTLVDQALAQQPVTSVAQQQANQAQGLAQSSSAAGSSGVQKAPVNYSNLVKRGGGRLGQQAPTMEVQRAVQGTNIRGVPPSRGGRGRDYTQGRGLQNGMQSGRGASRGAPYPGTQGRRNAGMSQGPMGRGRWGQAPTQSYYGRGGYQGRGAPGYGQQGGRPGRGGAMGRGRDNVQPINVPDEDFDFEEHLAKFDKEKLLEEFQDKAVISETEQNKKLYTPDNFFDEISCETLERSQKALNGDGGYNGEIRQKLAEQRKIDLQTFGQSALRAQNLGRGGRGYRGGPRGPYRAGGRQQTYQSNNYKGNYQQDRGHGGRSGRGNGQTYSRGRGGRGGPRDSPNN